MRICDHDENYDFECDSCMEELNEIADQYAREFRRYSGKDEQGRLIDVREHARS